jgi:hypothetical protein
MRRSLWHDPLARQKPIECFGVCTGHPTLIVRFDDRFRIVELLHCSAVATGLTNMPLAA